jgi:hypothetical protein
MCLALDSFTSMEKKPGIVVQNCNSIYLEAKVGGWRGLRPFWAKLARPYLKKKKKYIYIYIHTHSQAPIAYICNPSYSGDRDQ